MSKSSFVAAFLIVGPLVACGDAGSSEEAPSGPAPTDPYLVDASEATRAETGVAKWGIASDEATHATILRGYDASNRRLAEIRQTFELIDADHAAIRLTMTGAKGEATMRVELTATKNGDDAQIDGAVVENTFDQLPDAQKLLAHLEADTAAGAGQVGSGSLVGSGQTKPQAEGQQLVQPCQAALQSCGQQLNRASQAVSSSADSCAKLVRSANFTLVCAGAGALIGGAIGFFGGGVGALPGAWGGATFAARGCAALSGFATNGFDCVADSWNASSAQGEASRCQDSARQNCSSTTMASMSPL